eukprot:TRINITY_DN70294_c0_g1_i1.p1 TRINITY_DN70294_c0_g1~~TRINITY_DN70294_c0_g1_i1.p1  ORF type:complete len:301 (+),score=60.00 TRINITY_DN70294_c0_g1_i1:113-904(+)
MSAGDGGWWWWCSAMHRWKKWRWVDSDDYEADDAAKKRRRYDTESDMLWKRGCGGHWRRMTRHERAEARRLRHRSCSGDLTKTAAVAWDADVCGNWQEHQENGDGADEIKQEEATGHDPQRGDMGAEKDEDVADDGIVVCKINNEDSYLKQPGALRQDSSANVMDSRCRKTIDKVDDRMFDMETALIGSSMKACGKGHAEDEEVAQSDPRPKYEEWSDSELKELKQGLEEVAQVMEETLARSARRRQAVVQKCKAAPKSKGPA